MCDLSQPTEAGIVCVRSFFAARHDVLLSKCRCLNTRCEVSQFDSFENCYAVEQLVYSQSFPKPCAAI